MLEDILNRTDTCNRLAVGAGGGGTLLSEDACGEDPILSRMNALYHAASGLRILLQKEYRRILVLLAAASALLTFAFLMYDEAGAIWMTLVCGAMLGAALLLNRYVVRSD